MAFNVRDIILLPFVLFGKVVEFLLEFPSGPVPSRQERSEQSNRILIEENQYLRGKIREQDDRHDREMEAVEKRYREEIKRLQRQLDLERQRR